MKLHRDFKGIWISKDIWLIPNLKPTYRVFLAEIDSLDNGDGCFAKNAHFAMMFSLSKNRCSEIIMMLENEGFITVEHDVKNGDELRRIIHMNHPFGKSTTPSVSRQTPSVSRQTPSENRLRIYKELEIQLDKQLDSPRALDFLFLNYENRFTTDFLMPYKSRIKNFKKFWDEFNDKVDFEKCVYDAALFFRLFSFARNWIDNHEKYQLKQDQQTTAQDNIKKTYAR